SDWSAHTRLDAQTIPMGALPTLDLVAARAERLSRKTGSLATVRLALYAAFTATPATATDKDIEAGAVYIFAVGPETAEAVSRITAGLAGTAGVRLTPGAAEAVRKTLLRTINRGLSVKLVNGVETPEFTEKNPPPELPVHPTRKFDTELAVRVLRVGDKEKLARVKL